MILRNSYRSGKFGNWARPGLRKYLRDNPTESKWRDLNETKKERKERNLFLQENQKIFAI